MTGKSITREAGLGRENVTGFKQYRPAQETPDYEEIVLAMSEAYEELAFGIHESVQAHSRYLSPSTRAESFEYVLNDYDSGHEEKPEYLESYNETRNKAYAKLFQYALDKNDFGPVLGLITDYQEPVLAKRLLSALSEGTASIPRAPDSHPSGFLINESIDKHDKYINGVKQSSKMYAISTAKRELLYAIRRELNSEETGILRALALGIKIKLGLPRNGKKWRNITIEEPLLKITHLPTVPQQLIRKELDGLQTAD